MDLLTRLLYMLGLLGVGVAARALGVLDDRRTNWLNRFAFYVALPALIFVSTYAEPLGEILSPTLVVGLWIVVLVTASLSWIVHRRRRTPATRGVAVVQSYHSNFGYLGLPLVAATLGSAAAAKASLILGVGALTQVPLTVLILLRVTDTDASVLDELRGVVTNPVLVALSIGLLFSWQGATVPAAAATGLGYLSDLALPVALLCVGASLELTLPERDYGTIGSVVALKVFFMPLLAWATFTALGAPTLTLQAGVLMFGAPTAVSTYIYASELGGNRRIASVNIFVTTVVSIVTLFGALQFLL
ncbi:MAG: AEC family transporter [Halapricum sp.]